MHPQGELGRGDAPVPSDNPRGPQRAASKRGAEQGGRGVGHENLCLRAYEPPHGRRCPRGRCRRRSDWGAAPMRRAGAAPVKGQEWRKQGRAASTAVAGLPRHRREPGT